MTHPDWDDRLWLGETVARDWLGKPPPRPMALNDTERFNAYRAIKRRFFFEHAKGTELFALVPTDEQDFQETLRAGEDATAAVVRDLVLALNRFFEPDCPDTKKATSSCGRAIGMTSGRHRRSCHFMRCLTSTCVSNR